jgi:hypothetical protein
VSTVNGVGTFYYRDRGPLADGSQIATSYVVLFFFPLLPLATHRIRKHDVTGGSMQIEVLERLPLAWRSILWTYIKVWLGVPLVVFMPGFVLAFGFLMATQLLGVSVTPELPAFKAFIILNGAYMLAALVFLLGRARRA